MMHHTAKTLFVIRPHSIVDLITNSSSELFVFNGKQKKVLKNSIEAVYPDYLSEYKELKSVDDLRPEELNTYMSFVCSSRMWPATKSMYPVLPGFTFDELYTPDDNGVPAWNGEIQYQLRNNEGCKYGDFVTEQNFEEIKNKLDPNREMFFLFSLDENPNWDMQEELESFGTRYHLG